MIFDTMFKNIVLKAKKLNKLTKQLVEFVLSNHFSGTFSKYIPYILIFVLNFIIFRYFFKLEGLVVHSDTAAFNLQMNNLYNLGTNVWVEKLTSPGIAYSLPAYLQNFFSLNIIYSIFYFFVKHQELNNLLWVFLPFPLFGFSLYNFFNFFIKNRLLSLISTLIYSSSVVYFTWFVISGSNILLWSLIGCLWFSLAYIRSVEIEHKKFVFYNAMIAGLASLLAISNVAYFYVFILFLIMYFFFLFFNNILKKNVIKNILKNSFIFFGVTFLLNLFWIIPSFLMRTNVGLTFGTKEDPTMQYLSSVSSIIKNVMFYVSASVTNNKIYTFTILLLLIISCYYVWKYNDKILDFFFFAYSAFLLISLGSGSVLWFFIEKIPGSFLLRTPQRVYSLMLVIFLILICLIINKYKSRANLFLLIVLLLLNFNTYKTFKSSDLVTKFPKSYQSAAEYIEKTAGENHRVAIYPHMPWFLNLTWSEKQAGIPPVLEYMTSSRFLGYWLDGHTTPEVLKPIFRERFIKENQYNLEKILGFYNVSLLVYQDDVSSIPTSPGIDPSLQFTKTQLESIVFDSKEIKVFKINDRYIKNIFYVPEKVYKVTEMPLKLVSEKEGDFAFVEEEQFTNNSYQDSEIKFSKFSPSKYTVEIEKNKVFLLAFQESFHPGWRLYYKDNQLNFNHLKLNGFINGWEIDSSKICNDFGCDNSEKLEIDVEFMPQKYTHPVIYLTYAIILMMILLLIIKRKWGKYESK